MMLEGVSSSHLAPSAPSSQSEELLTELPSLVRGYTIEDTQGRRLEMSQNGYQPSHGLTHARILHVSADGRTVDGEDILTTLDAADNAIFDTALANAGPIGILYAARFHLHPDVEATLDMGATAVAMRLKSGEVWVFRHDGQAKLSLSASVYLQNGRLRPRTSQQVVLSGSAMAYATRVRWSLAKAQDTPNAVRDLVQADPMDDID
jgi:uncharacterized heparinase superfamily protein